MCGATPPADRRLRSCAVLPSLLVVVSILVVVFGGYVAAGALSESAGPPVAVGDVVRVPPLSGWEVARRFAGPLLGVRLTRGVGNLDVFAASFGGDATDLAHRYVSGSLEPNAVRLSVSPSTAAVRLRSGLEGVQLHYVGSFGGGQAPVEGEVTALVTASGTGVVFDAWAPQGLLQYVVDDTRTMIQDTVVS
jgi:hypothetical protein